MYVFCEFTFRGELFFLCLEKVRKSLNKNYDVFVIRSGKSVVENLKSFSDAEKEQR